MRNIIVIEEKSLSTDYEKRYVVQDADTKEVLDNTQGYGYKSIQKAYAAYNYKNRDKSKDKEKQKKRREFKIWMNEHADFVKLMDTISFEIAKGSWDSNEKFDAKFVKSMLKENNLESDFTAGELLKIWEKN